MWSRDTRGSYPRSPSSLSARKNVDEDDADREALLPAADGVEHERDAISEHTLVNPAAGTRETSLGNPQEPVSAPSFPQAQARDAYGAELTPEWAALSSMQRSSVYGAFVVLGAAVLLPFNALITPSEYYRGLFAATTHSDNFMSYIISIYNVATIIFGAHATASVVRVSPYRRTVWSSVVVFITLSLITVWIGGSAAEAQTKSDRAGTETSFWTLMLITAVLAIATAYLQNAVVAMSSLFGGKAMGAMLAGQGFVAAAVSLIQLLATVSSVRSSQAALALGKQPEPAFASARASALIFYIWTCAFMLLTLLVLEVLSRSALYRVVTAQHGRSGNALSSDPSPATTPELADPRAKGWESGAGLARFIPSKWRTTAASLRAVQSQLVALSVAIAWCFTVTLALFPALTSRVRPWPRDAGGSPSESEPLWRDPLIFVALHYLVFNASDLLGRLLPSLLPKAFLLESRRAIIFWAGMREGFLGMMPMCNVSRQGATKPAGATSASLALPASGRIGSIASLAIRAATTAAASTAASDDGLWAAVARERRPRLGDATFFVLVLLLGLSNGILSTSIMIVGPRREGVKDHERALAGTILAFWLTIGLAAGSFASFIWS
ncbi:Nucleoside transporter [Ceraceosorus bombacis]|uniref:Nucleoside transporter n=1 Tax=Ceraceosorus bombacis TaxID=401625 RepID=A0A0P1BBT0_9BASI|nr:Nucleoside transporter [Ceraceosorus bombacis]